MNKITETMRESWNTLLERRLGLWGLRLLPEGVISQDGDCYCDSITFCLGQWTEDDGTEARDTASQAFRKKTVNWLRRHSPEFEFRDGWKIRDLLFDHEPLEDFARRMNKPQEWFEGAAVFATVEILERELILISTRSRRLCAALSATR
jgi:hypothetical protein